MKAKKEFIWTCLDIEVACARHFDFRSNLIVPNVSWGLGFRHEIDVLVCTRAGYLTEIEIKTTASDLRRDFQKSHCHMSLRLRRQFFAVPKKLVALTLELARPGWGVLSLGESGVVETVRPAKINRAALPLKPEEITHLYELASMRTWTLKETLRSHIKRDRLKKYAA